MRSIAVIAVVIAAIGSPEQGQAQTRISVQRGIGQYDLSGVDEGTVTALRVTRDFSRYFSLDAGVAHIALEQDFGDTDLYQPEVQAQARLPLGRFSPHLGVGFGFAIDVPEEDTNVLHIETDRDITIHAGAGVRVDLGFRLGLVLDGRIRNIGKPWSATGSDAALGLSYRF